LRFPEFQDAGEWLYMNGDMVFEKISNKNHNSDLPILAITQEHGAIPRDKIDYSVSVTEKSVKSYKIVEVGDFIISLRSFQGGIEYSHYKGICSPAYIILRKKNDVVNHYFKHYFKTGIFVQDLNRDIEGIRDGKMVSYKQFSDILLPTPSPPEQQKIADCLSSIDELITAHTQKYEALKAHKKGLLQQLFPAEGKTVPKLRFPEFQDAGEWKEAKLGDKEISEFVKDRIPLDKLDIGNYISTENLLPDYAGVKTAAKLPPSGSFIQFRIKDVLISNIRPYLKKVWQAQMNGGASNDVIVVRAKNKIIDNFLMCKLKNDDFINFIMKDAKGLKMPRGDLSSIKKYPFSYPSPDEQKKIADCLSSLDGLTAAQAQKIESLKAHKKGLLQQLFPAAEQNN